MKLFIMGYTHLSGTSRKTNKDYDFYQVETLSRRNGGEGAPLMSNVMAIQAPAFENIIAPALPSIKDFPALLSAEFDNRGTLVEAALLNSGADAVTEIFDSLT